MHVSLMCGLFHGVQHEENDVGSLAHGARPQLCNHVNVHMNGHTCMHHQPEGTVARPSSDVWALVEL